MKVFKFAVGLAVGYVLGSRAGRDKYEQIAAAARKAQDHPLVIDAKQKVKGLIGAAEPAPAPAPAATEPAVLTPVGAATAPAARSPRRQPKTTLSEVGTVTEPLP